MKKAWTMLLEWNSFLQNDKEDHIVDVLPMELVNREGNLYTFKIESIVNNAGTFKYSYRMFPKNPNLPHRQDFCYIRYFNK